MKKAAIGLALLFALCGPAAQACGFVCMEVSENCWGCVYLGGESGCRPTGSCSCQDELCWAPTAATEAAVTPEAFGIFAPTPNSTQSAALAMPITLAIQ